MGWRFLKNVIKSLNLPSKTAKVGKNLIKNNSKRRKQLKEKFHGKNCNFEHNSLFNSTPPSPTCFTNIFHMNLNGCIAIINFVKSKQRDKKIPHKVDQRYGNFSFGIICNCVEGWVVGWHRYMSIWSGVCTAKSDFLIELKWNLSFMEVFSLQKVHRNFNKRRCEFELLAKWGAHML